MKLKLLILKSEEVYKYEGLSEAILSMKGRLDLGNRVWFVFFYGASWIAFGGYREIDAQRVYVGPTLVKPEFRGKGLQRKLLRARIKKAKQDGYLEAISNIYAHNYISGNNLIAEGFRMTNIPRYYDIEVDEVWFSKLLK